jgi:hypothetical protein
MEAHMELSKRTTILLTPGLHERLTRIAARRGVSLGELVRTACEREYGEPSPDDRLAAVRELVALDLPVGTPEEMARQSVAAPKELLP